MPYESRTPGSVRGFLRKDTPAHRLGTARDDPRQVITLSPAQRRAHTQIVGATGRGKSVLVEYLIRQDLEDTSAGVCLIDPHGQTYHELVSYLAHFRPELAERVILFNPSDQSEAVLGFNPIGPHALESPLFALNSVLVGILRSWGQGSLELTPRIVRWLENIFTVIIANRLTLVESLPLISAARDLSERTQLLSKLNVEIVRQDWEEYDQATSTQRHAYIEGAHNRLRKLLRNPHLRNMFGVQTRTLDMERVIREKKILLVNLAPNRNIDLEDMRLIGILLIHEIFRAAMHRDPNANPAPFYLYIDEFSQFVTDDIAYMLEQCRKFGLFVTLIHQQLAQLRRDSEYLFASVLTNCQNRIAFGGLSAEDSELMVKELHSGFEQFHEVKYRTETTKFRPIEVLRPTYTVGSSHTDAATAAFLHGLSAATSVGRTLSKGIQQSETTSEAQARGRSETRTHAIAEALSQARMHHRSRGTGQGQATGLTASESHTDSASHTTGASLGSSEGEATALGMGMHTGSMRHLDPATGALITTGSSQGTSQNQVTTHQESAQSSHSTADTAGQSDSKGLARSRVQSTFTSEAAGEGKSEATSQSVSTGQALGTSETDIRGRATTTGTHESEAESVARMLGISFSQSEGTQQSDTKSASVAFTIGHQMDEFTEVTEHPWSLQEILHRLMADLKNQGPAEATVRLGNGPPQRLRVDWLPRAEPHPLLTPQRLAAFRQRVYQAAPEYYQTPGEAEMEIRGRQLKIFQREFAYDWFAMPTLTAPPLPAPDTPDAEDSPFTDWP
ncbi:MAG: helicase HerA domain-containing protein [Gemmatimonadales bacterium]